MSLMEQIDALIEEANRLPLPEVQEIPKRFLPCGIHEDVPFDRDHVHVEECLGCVCPACGQKAHSGWHYSVNHGVYGPGRECVSQGLRKQHVWAVYQRLTGKSEHPFTNCWVKAHNHRTDYRKEGWPIECVLDTLIERRELALQAKIPPPELPPIHELEIAAQAA